ncbi:hypothetical protein SCB49_12589 [unidentified eubacterium SCB49]|nr:hypothetical protein SCB49_12589 [unidentified eubacterium SCB49]
MKLFTSLRWMMIPMVVLLFASCDNEPIDANFPDIEEEVILEPGQLVATFNGNSAFNAGVTSGVLSSDGFLVLSGANQGSDEILSLSVENAEVGSFSLNAGEGTLNSAVFTIVEEAANPYTTATALGGSGSMIITELDMTEQIVSGTFGFIANRIKLDAAGNPVNDSSGNPIIETLSASNGEYFQIPFTLENTDDGGGEDDDTIPDGDQNVSNSFEAYIDAEGNENDGQFVGETIVTDLASVGGVPVVRITAINTDGESIRIDIPEELELGTYDMVDLSDGTELIALYSDGQGTANLTSNPGTLTITDFSKATGRIVGTFEFTATDPLDNKTNIVEASNGEFTIYYEPNPENIPEPITVLIDEVALVPTEVETGVYLFAGSDAEVVTFTAADELQSVTVTFPRDITTGTYTMVPEQIDGSEVIGFYTPDTEIIVPQVFTSITGTFNVNSYDTITGNIEGTFSFTATDPTGQDSTVYEITEGTFFFTIED